MEEKEKPRLSRLTAIITQLQSKRLVTANYLAEKHNVSIRTIYREILKQNKYKTFVINHSANQSELKLNFEVIISILVFSLTAVGQRLLSRQV